MRAFVVLIGALARLLGIIAWFLLAVLVGVFVALQTEWARDGLRDTILGYLNNGIRGRVEVDRIGGTLPFSVELEGVRIFDPDGFETLSVERFAADIDLLQLLDRRVELARVEVLKPDLRLFDPAQRIAIARAFEPRTPSPPRPPRPDTGTPSPWIVRIGSVDFERARLGSLAPGLDVGLSQLDLSVAIIFGPNGLRWNDLAIDASIEAPTLLAWLFAGGGLSVRSSGLLGASSIDIQTFTAQVGPHAIGLEGLVDLQAPDRSRIDIDGLTVDTRGWHGVPAEAQGVAQGYGSVRTHRDGAQMQLVVFTPLGELWVQGGATLGDLAAIARGKAAPVLGEWSLAVEGAHLRVPESWAPPGSSMAEVVHAGQVELMVTVDGYALPTAPDHRLRGDVDIVAVAGDGAVGHALVRMRHLPANAKSPAGWGFRLEFDRMGLQPWLTMAGVPTVDGMAEQITARGILTLLPETPGGFELIVGGGLRGSLDGTLPASEPGAPPVIMRVGRAQSRFQVQWNGSGLPEVALFARTDQAAVFGAEADALAVRLFSGQVRDGGARFDAEVSGEVLRIGPLFIGDATVPIGADIGPELTLENVRIEPSVGRLMVGDAFMSGRVRGPLRIVAEGEHHRVRGTLVGTDLVAGPASTARADIDLDVRLPRLERPERLVGEAVSAEVTATLEGSRVTGGSETAVGAEMARVSAEVRWPRGFEGPLDLIASIEGERVRTPAAQTDRATGRIEGRIDPAGSTLETLIPRFALSAELDSALIVASPLLGRRPFKRVTVSASRVGAAPIPLVAHVDVDGEGIWSFDFQGQVTPPNARQPVSADIETFVLQQRGQDQPAIEIAGARLSPEGIISVTGLTVRGRDDSASRLTAGGYLDIVRGEVDANIDLVGIDIASFVGRFESFLNQPLLSQYGAGGRIDADIDMYGTLADPTLSLTLDLVAGSWQEARGLKAGIRFNAAPTGVTTTANASWREGLDNIVVDAELPGRWSLDPVGIVWDEGRTIRAHVDVREPDLAGAITTLGELGLMSEPPDLAGGVVASLDIGGRPGDASTRLSVATSGLVIAGRDDGDLTLDLDTASPETRVEFRWMRDSGARLAQVLATLPFTPVRALGQDDPVAYAITRMKAAPSTLSVDIPMTRLGDTPLAAFVTNIPGTIAIETDVQFEGTLVAPAISGRIDVAGLSLLPEASVTRIELLTALDTLNVGVSTLTGDGAEWLDGKLRLPVLSRFTQSPERALEVLSDPAFRADIFTADVRTFDFWRLLPDVGDAATQFMPDGTLMLHVNARGGEGGPTGTVFGRLRTHVPTGARDGGSLNPRQRAALRNIANDIVVTAQLTPVRTSARVTMLQEPPAVPVGQAVPVRPHEHLSMELLVNLGSEALLAGRPIDIDATQIQANIDAHEFGLGGLAASMRSLLGSTDGTVGGRIEIDGTVGEPHIAGDLLFAFSELAIAPVGFRRKEIKAKLTVSGEDNRVVLEGLDFEEPDPDGGEPARMGIRLAATVPAFSAARIRVDGGVTLARFPVVERKDGSVRLSGGITLEGILASPNIEGRLTVDRADLYPKLSGRSVRPVGLPAGVTMVRGEPAPPEVVQVPEPFRTSANINIRVDIPRDSTHLEPNLFLAIGEARAVLEPHTGEQGLQIRTNQGRIGIRGTVFVPTESVQFYGKNFVLDEDSRIVFTGDLDTDPQLRISARWNISHVDLSSLGLQTTRDSYVGVRVGGNAALPSITFMSEPRMDEGNILSIIALGRPTGSSDALDQQALGQVMSAFMNMATLALGKGLAETLPIEIVKFDNITGDVRDVRLTLCKRITDDLYVCYRSDWTGSRQTNSVWAEYRLGRLLFVAAEYGDNPNPQSPAETSVRASIRISP